MACGDRYRHLIANSFGYTWDDPCGAYCNDADHGAWNAAAVSLHNHKVLPAWRAYTQAVYSQGLEVDEGVRAQVEVFHEAVNSLPEPSPFRLPGGQAEMIAKATSAMELGVCALENLENATRALGAKPPPTPGTGKRPDEPPGLVGVLVLGGVVAVGGWLGVSLYRRRRRQTEE